MVRFDVESSEACGATFSHRFLRTRKARASGEPPGECSPSIPSAPTSQDKIPQHDTMGPFIQNDMCCTGLLAS